MTPDYIEALDRVAIGEFIKRGIKLRGVVHIGANDGYEVQWYQKLGLEILCFEPGSAAAARFSERYPEVRLYQSALGNVRCRATIHITDGDGGSSILPELTPSYVSRERTAVMRWSDLIDREEIKPTFFNACVIDVQGMELDVLRGMDEHIQDFDCFVVECSARPVYKGEASAEEVIRFMEKNGFSALNTPGEHDDVLFAKKSILPHPGKLIPPPLTKPLPIGTKLNCGSGQRPFLQEFGWINIDVSERWNPDLVADWNNLSMFDDASIELVVSCHSLEHAGCGQADGFIRESYRVLRPGGSLIILVPDPKALAQAFLDGRIDEYIFNVNTYGAYSGYESDYHRWSYSRQGMVDYLRRVIPSWHDVHQFNNRPLAGADLPADWWFYGMEAVK